MNTYLIIGIVVVALGVIIGILLSKKKTKELTLLEKVKKANIMGVDVSVKTIDGTINFADVVGWFKSLKLDKEKDIPFVGNANVFKDMLQNFEQKKSVALFIGVFDEKSDKIIHSQIIEADDFDQKTREVLGSEDLVVLR
jgi:hypothetical protein